MEAKINKVVKAAYLSGLLEDYWFQLNNLPFHAVASSNLVTPPVPLILVHGLGVSSRYMLPTGVALAPYMQVYAPDLPGFGKSATPRHVLNIRQLADVLAEFMELIGLKQAAFLANSMGCQVVIDLAVRYPHLVTRLILTGPTMDPHHRSSAIEILRLLKDVPGESLNQMHLALADYLKCGPRVMWQSFQYAMQDHIEDKLARVNVPVLVVRGSNDTIASQAWVEEIVSLLPTASLAIIPNAPHAVTNKAAVALVERVLPFLQGD